MAESWKPTAPGRLFTRSPDWSLTLDGERYELTTAGRRYADHASRLAGVSVDHGFFWSTVVLMAADGSRIDLSGIPNEDARRLEQTVTERIARIRHQEELARLIQTFSAAVDAIVRWARHARDSCVEQRRRRGWLTREFIAKIDADKPREFERMFDEPVVVQRLTEQPQEVRDAVSVWKRPFRELADSINQRHIADELTRSETFLHRVEKSPLTSEQAQAVICFDNRVLLVAAAGSGKTSVMIAKAGYALIKGHFDAEQILLLAFNADAAAELRERIDARLGPMGLPAERILVKTFHSFGLDVIGAATGKRPSLAPWLDSGQDDRALMRIVDRLKDADVAFRTTWDLFRIVFGKGLSQTGAKPAPDGWDREAKREGFRTLNDEVVKSEGERLIADWLFYNGVRYQYERPYEHDTADSSHRQYCPDFYLPDADAYLEHWGLDANGKPPEAFVGYEASMAWKKALHQQHGTRLLETTTAQLYSGKVFEDLPRKLGELGVKVDPNPDRPVPGRAVIEAPRLIRTFRTFLVHVKNNRLDLPTLRSRARDGAAGEFRFRNEMFLQIFEKLWDAWEEELRRDEHIDFEDMLNLATDHIEQGRWKSPFDLVMVDEFQDVSHSRARLLATLVQAPGRHLFAVGDDWQSINRFAGADLSVMTGFESIFGPAEQMNLETTFRCPQALCDVSSAFVQENPKQIRKRVRSARQDVAEPVRIIEAEDGDEDRGIRAAVEARVNEIAREHADPERKPKIFILGRYRRDRQYIPRAFDRHAIEVEFVTIHSSKGLEADHVIIPGMTSATLGFPSQVIDDPALQMALPEGDAYPFAEERRLFYVALTRARSTVTLVTLAHRQSTFITELVRSHNCQVRRLDGTTVDQINCPRCHVGVLVERKSKYGAFFGCTSFPRCRHTQDHPPGSVPTRRRPPNSARQTRAASRQN